MNGGKGIGGAARTRQQYGHVRYGHRLEFDRSSVYGCLWATGMGSDTSGILGWRGRDVEGHRCDPAEASRRFRVKRESESGS